MLKKNITAFFGLIILSGFVVLGFIYLNNQPVSTSDSVKIFTVKSGEGVKSIAQKLEDSKLIKNKYVFLFYSYRLSLAQKIQAGNFKISPNLTTKEIAVKLTKSGVTDYWLKVLDGTRVEELQNSFPSNISFTSADFISKSKSLQGYIFPDSYLIPEYYTIDQILALIKTRFDQKFSQAKEGSTTQLSDSNAVVLASLLEREGRSLESKQMISGIIANRLSIDMPLQIDATVQYARDSQTKNITEYWTPVTSAQIKSIESSYNTYKNTGLPPRPICNPGYNSLYAAFHPTKSDYLYYITGNDGKMYYAKTLDEHNSNVAKYLR